MRRLLVVLALASCGHRDETPPAPTRIPILPDTITGRLGTVGLALAVDFHAIDVQELAGAQGPKLPCAHDLLVGVRDAVVTVGDGGWQGIIDGLPAASTRACLAQLGIAAHDGSGGGLEIDAMGKQLVARWRGDIATLVEAGADERHGEVPDAMKDVIAQVPRGVAAWLAVTGLPDYKIEQAVGWLEVGPKAWTFTVNATGATPTAAKEWLDSLVRGFTVALAGRGLVVDGSWFAVTEKSPAATLVATIPTVAFGSGSN
jgi:hypothetical protein